MTFSRPTLLELVAQAEAGIRSRLEVGPLLDRSVLRVLARVQAGLTHGQYGALEFQAENLVPTASRTAYLERWADLFGIQRKAATFAQGTVRFTGTNGSSVPAGTLVQRADGSEYSTDVAGTIAGGQLDVAVTAQASGNAGDAVAGTELQLTAPIAGVDTTSTVQAPGLVGGAETETDAQLFDRFRQRTSQPPQGGAEADYVAAALAVSEVTRAFVETGSDFLGLGTVGVSFLVDDDPLGPVPDAAKVAEVQAALDAFRPVTADATAFAPSTLALPVIFTSLTPNTAEVQAAITASLTDLLLREVEPGGTLPLSKVREAISTSAGEEDHALSSPSADVTTTAGQILVLGSVVFP